jgi:hypothetical protein
MPKKGDLGRKGAGCPNQKASICGILIPWETGGRKDAGEKIGAVNLSVAGLHLRNGFGQPPGGIK